MIISIYCSRAFNKRETSEKKKNEYLLRPLPESPSQVSKVERIRNEIRLSSSEILFCRSFGLMTLIAAKFVIPPILIKTRRVEKLHYEDAREISSTPFHLFIVAVIRDGIGRNEKKIKGSFVE